MNFGLLIYITVRFVQLQMANTNTGTSSFGMEIIPGPLPLVRQRAISAADPDADELPVGNPVLRRDPGYYCTYTIVEKRPVKRTSGSNPPSLGSL